MASRYLRDGAGALTGPTLQEAVFAGTVDPGNIVAVREILTGSGGPDRALFTGPRADYTVTTTPVGATLGSPGSVTTVVDNVGADGTDTLRNIEFLQFSDTVLTNAPVIGTATAGAGQATVRWTAPTVGTADTFSVRVLDVTTNPAGVQVGALRTAPAGATSLVVTGLTNGSQYRFQVLASNALGNSPFSALSNTVSPTTATAPGAPAIGTATAGNASATLTWTAPASNGGSAITGYTVRAFAGTVLARTQPVTGNVGTVVVTGLTNGTAYTFDVAAVNAVGTSGFSARTAAVTPRTEFVAPTVTARTPAAGAVSFSQTANLTATFSEAVTGVSGTTFQLRLGTTVVPTVVSYNTLTRVATLNPVGTLTADRVYTVNLVGIRDLAGNTMATTTWTFTTGPNPTITATTPATGATGVLRNSNVTATFSEAITGFAVAGKVRIERVSTGTEVASAVTFNTTTRVLTINPGTSLLANTQYRVTITGGTTGVRDLAGNPLTTRIWTFTTGAAL